MRTKTSTFFECKIRYEKMTEDGMLKKVTETYTVDALSFTEAEKCVTEEMSTYISGEMKVTAIKIAPYTEIFISDADTDDKFYKVRCNFITLDENSGKEKKTPVNYLVQAATVETVRKYIDEAMSGTMLDYVIVSVVETSIMDVFEHSI